MKFIMKGMVKSEAFKIIAIFENLPPDWKELKNHLKHDEKDLNIEDFIMRLRIGENNSNHKEKVIVFSMENKTNIVKKNKSKFKHTSHKYNKNEKNKSIGLERKIMKIIKCKCNVDGKPGLGAKNFHCKG